MAPEDRWTPLPLPGAGPRRVRALLDLCRCLSARLRGDPLPVAADWSAVVATAENYRLTPALWEAVRGTSGTEESLATRLRAEYAANVVTTAWLSEQLHACLGILNHSGISPLVLKGALGLLEGGSTLPARMMTDLDLLVADQEFEGACSALRHDGYVVYPAPGGAGRFEWVARRPDLAAPIDLHRALGVGAVARVLPVSDVLGRASESHVGGISYRVMHPADQLAHAVVHSQCNDKAHRTGSIALRQLHNFAVLHHHVSDPDAWPTAQDRLTHQGLRHVVGGHAALERYLFGLDLPVPQPSTAARLHLARCVVSAAIPHLSDIQTNLLLAFEAPTMTTRYPGASSGSARVRHAFGLLRGGMEAVRQEALRSRNH